MSQRVARLRFDRLTIVRQVGSNSSGERLFECKCDCGGLQIAILRNLRKGLVRSCGCLRHELLLQRNAGETNVSYKHGYHKHPLYQVWQNFKQRCFNPKNQQYKNYGARGITVSKVWVNNPERFVKWGLTNGWKKGLLIDREDNDGNYTPKNCRFVTPEISSNNKRYHRNQYSK